MTVDPKRDTPERLREHLTAFNPSFLGATGTPDELAAVLKAYGIVADQVVSQDHALGYEVDHSSFLYLVDPQGRLRGSGPFVLQPATSLTIPAPAEDADMSQAGVDALGDARSLDADGPPAPSPSRTWRRRGFGIVALAILAPLVLAAIGP